MLKLYQYYIQYICACYAFTNEGNSHLHKQSTNYCGLPSKPGHTLVTQLLDWKFKRLLHQHLLVEPKCQGHLGRLKRPELANKCLFDICE